MDEEQTPIEELSRVYGIHPRHFAPQAEADAQRAALADVYGVNPQYFQPPTEQGNDNDDSNQASE